MCGCATLWVLADAELVALRVVHDDVVDRVLRVVVSGPALHAGAEPDQLGDLGLDDLDPPLQRQQVVAAGGVQVQVEPVLARLGLWDLLEPDRRAQPRRVEQPIVEGRLLAQPGAVVRVPGRRRLGRRYRLVAQRLRSESCQPGRVVRVDRQLPEHHARC